jgi:hypothetical protein
MNRNRVARLVDVAYWTIVIVFIVLLIYTVVRPEVFSTPGVAPLGLALAVVSFVLSQVRIRLRRR